uniref:Ovule protein n=1 Tax=Romanomermis culicivorax TaxID=13658 RepID=A0A915I8G8_ROMCU
MQLCQAIYKHISNHGIAQLPYLHPQMVSHNIGWLKIGGGVPNFLKCQLQELKVTDSLNITMFGYVPEIQKKTFVAT